MSRRLRPWSLGIKSCICCAHLNDSTRTVDQAAGFDMLGVNLTSVRVNVACDHNFSEWIKIPEQICFVAALIMLLRLYYQKHRPHSTQDKWTSCRDRLTECPVIGLNIRTIQVFTHLKRNGTTVQFNHDWDHLVSFHQVWLFGSWGGFTLLFLVGIKTEKAESPDQSRLEWNGPNTKASLFPLMMGSHKVAGSNSVRWMECGSFSLTPGSFIQVAELL